MTRVVVVPSVGSPGYWYSSRYGTAFGYDPTGVYILGGIGLSDSSLNWAPPQYWGNFCKANT